ncbi:MAG: amidohydrolase [Eubacteriaceae bacterium]|jgi:5-methylthioadenosine/S-adenosylhomocysteine deaminase|nr:amidohydrolase [Eubacteriaceae bacterium]
MYFNDITIIDSDFCVREHMHVVTDGVTISYIGSNAPEKVSGDVYDGRGKLLMPGFVNAHAHSPMTLMRGYGENMALQEWLNDRIFPFEAKLTGERVYWGTLLAMAESLRFGIVSTSDMYYFCDDMARAVLDAGCKNNISRSITNFTDEDLSTMKAAAEMKSFYENFNGAGGGKILVDMSLHAEYTNPEKTVRQLAEYTKKIGANMHVHVSETKTEHEECKARHEGRTPVKFLSDLGLFDTRTTAAHCVWVEPEDMDILKEKNVTVACNPVSNMKLASGVCNVPELLARGINTAIGTDSVSSNNSLNFIEEMKAFATAPKMMYNDPTAVTPKQTIIAAAAGGAAAQGREDCGRIKEGFRADLIVLDVSGPNMHPVHDMLNNIVYSASGSDVCLTMTDGKVLYKDGEYMTIDVEKAIYETEKATNEILSEL